MLPYFRFCFGLSHFLRRKIELPEAYATIKRRIAGRKETFLRMTEKGIYGYPRSPYLKLLNAAKIEFRHIRELVQKRGIEATLEKLKDEGIFVTVEEFKGKKAINRRGTEFWCQEKDFDNPYFVGAYEVSSGATRSAGTRIRIDFDFLTDKSHYTAVIMDIHGNGTMPIALWFPIYPGAPGLNSSLRFAKINNPPERWFSQVDKWSPKVSWRKRWGTKYILFMAGILGERLPRPEFLDLNNALDLAEWARKKLTAHPECWIYTFVSSAVRVCLSARENNLDISGTKFMVTGEPLSARKRKIIEAANCSAIPIYGISEGGVIAAGCTRPAVSDDCHLVSDEFTVIQYQRTVRESAHKVNAFLLTSLLPTSPKILLNAETGDHGVVEPRDCGCPFYQLGLRQHIYNIRSFEKLTGEGVTFVNSDFIRIVDETLPDRFGGESTDYQIVESEDGAGLTRLNILVSPRIGPVKEQEVLAAFFAELASSSSTPDSWRIAGSKMWSQGNTVRVVRAFPFSTRAGKILSFHIAGFEDLRGRNE